MMQRKKARIGKKIAHRQDFKAARIVLNVHEVGSGILDVGEGGAGAGVGVMIGGGVEVGAATVMAATAVAVAGVAVTVVAVA